MIEIIQVILVTAFIVLIKYGVSFFQEKRIHKKNSASKFLKENMIFVKKNRYKIISFREYAKTGTFEHSNEMFELFQKEFNEPGLILDVQIDRYIEYKYQYCKTYVVYLTKSNKIINFDEKHLRKL